MSYDTTVDDKTLRDATGLHIDTLRRLATEKLLVPIETPRGRGRMRRWSIENFRRAALIAGFISAGFTAPWASPLVNEFTETLLHSAATAKFGDHQIAIYQRTFAFIESPNARAQNADQTGLDYGWRNDRLLIALLSGRPPAWRGFVNIIPGLNDQVPERLTHEEATRMREAISELQVAADIAHAVAENYEYVFKLNATRVIRRAEQRAGLAIESGGR